MKKSWIPKVESIHLPTHAEEINQALDQLAQITYDYLCQLQNQIEASQRLSTDHIRASQGEADVA
jgi:hypothetical protein